jgi:hypothetical protein
VYDPAPVPHPRRLAPLLLLGALAACDAPTPRPRRARAAGPDTRPVRVELRVADDGAPARRLPPPIAADSAYGDPSTWPSRVIHFTAREGEPLTIWAGDTVLLSAPEPPEGTPEAIASDVRWSTLPGDVVAVSATGTLVARRPGTTAVVAWRRVGEVTTPVTVLPAARGRVLVADGGPDGARDGDPPDAVVVIQPDDAPADSVRTDAGGRFLWRAGAPLAGDASVVVTPTGRSAARYHPTALGRVPLAELARLDIVLVPRRWRLDVGSYAGTEIAIDPGSAIARLRDGSRFWRFARRSDGGGLTRPVGWEPRRLPVPVALDVRGIAGAVDSAAFWAAARQLERDWGGPLFVPVSPDEARRDGWNGIAVDVEPGIPAAGYTTISADGEGDIGNAEVAFKTRSYARDPGIVTHELLHALGIGHTERQESVMRVGGSILGRASPEDVAYGRLLYAVREVRARAGAQFGIAPDGRD